MTMLLQRSIDEPIRPFTTTEAQWFAEDKGLICCWERGRQKAVEEPELAAKARSGVLVPLAWKGGIRKPPKSDRKKAPPKIGTHFYLATWQGLRGEPLDLDTDAEPTIKCSATGVVVLFTGDVAKYGASDGDNDD